LLSELLKDYNIKHNVLNAKPKNAKSEAETISQAGRLNSITIATNMAGRGTDIQLGGNKNFIIANENKTSEQINKIKIDKEKVKSFGGLHIVGTERHESRRIDNQLRGRSGRQGDPGESIFFVSLEDDLMRIFGSEKLKSMLSTLGLKRGEVIEHKWLTSSIERAQKRVEGHNFDIRKQLLEFDNIIDKQRNIIYSKREMIISEDILNFITETEDEFVTNLLEGEEEEIKNFAETLPFLEDIDFSNKSLYLDAFKKIKAENIENHSLVYEQILKSVSLTILDKNCHNHLD
jgi:preprotein translocase subunit SecA